MPLGPLHGRTVYGLRSSRDGVVRYVGSTSRPLAERLSGHVAEVRCNIKWRVRAGLPVHAWMRIEILAGYSITAVPLIEDACVWCEEAEICRRLDAGEPLLNVTIKGRPRRYEAHLSVGTPLSGWTKRVRRGIEAHLRRREAA